MKRIQFLAFTLLLAAILFLPIKAATAQSNNTDNMVRLVYFLPKDRPARPERITALRRVIKEVQAFYADEMERHGYGRKTFVVERDKNGEPIVHHVDGKFGDQYYYEENTSHRVWKDTREHFNDLSLEHIYFTVIDISRDTLRGGSSCGEARREENIYGVTVIPASGICFEDDRGYRHRLGTSIHELAHNFGLEHDLRKPHDADTVAGTRSFRVSECEAEWLSVSPFFNRKKVLGNAPTEIQLVSTRSLSQDIMSLGFEMTDADGLHQVQLLVPEITKAQAGGSPMLLDCQPLSGKASRVEFAIKTAGISDVVMLHSIDVNGNITRAPFPIKLDQAALGKNTLDANSDGTVNLLDLASIASRLGQRGKNSTDANEDGVVNTLDLLLVAGVISSLPRQVVETFAATDVQKWLTDAKQHRIENEVQQKGIILLEYLLSEIEVLSKPVEGTKGSLKVVFEGHTGFVSSVAFSPDGQTLASGSWDGTVRLWDPHTAQHKILFIGHRDTVTSIAFSPNGETLVSADWEGNIRLWDPHTAELKGSFKVVLGVPLGSVVFSPDGQMLACANLDGTIWLFDPHTEQHIRTLTGHADRTVSVTFSADGQTLASGSWDKTIKLWNPNNGQLKRTLEGHTAGVEAVTFSPNGQTLASGSRNGTIRLWNLNNGREKKTLTGYTDWIKQIAFSPDGQMLASGSRDRRIRLWNTKTGEYKNSLQEAGNVMAVAFSLDGRTLASSGEDKKVRLWDVQMLLEEKPSLKTGPDKITGPWLWMIAPTETGQGGANSNNVDSLAVASGGTVTEVDVATNGATEGDSVGNLIWTLGEIAATGEDNITDLINKIGLGRGDVNDHSSYALITLESTRGQSGVAMHVGSDDSVKVWLNGEVVHNNPRNRGANNFQERFSVDLKQGDNLLLVKVSELRGWWSMFVGIDADVNAVYKIPSDTDNRETTGDQPADINEDGSVNVTDLLLVVTALSENAIPHRRADVNGDGIVNVADLLLVVENLDDPVNAAAPTSADIVTSLNPAILAGQLNILRAESDGSRKYQKAIAFLQSLLAVTRPDETQLLANYPNPFNPETWIPYQLSKPADVSISIYAADGKLVRTLDLGHQPVGMYDSRRRAAYWDGRNAVGERVASGVYFYTLSAGDITATRRMLIQK